MLRLHRISLGAWVGALIAGDMIGSVAITAVILRAFGTDWAQLGICAAALPSAWIVAAWTQSLYSQATVLAGLRAHSLRGVVSCVLTFGIVLLLGLSSRLIADVAPAWLAIWSLSVMAWIGGLRLIATWYFNERLKKGDCLDRVMVLAGSAGLARGVGDEVRRESRGHVGIAYAAAIPGTLGGPSMDWIEEVVRDGKVDRIIVAEFEDAVTQSKALIARLRHVAVDVTLIPSLSGIRAPVVNVGRIGSVPTIDLASRPLTVMQSAVKRAEDLVLAGLFLLATAPLLLLVSLAIKIDSPGPVLFGQWREGFHNVHFRVWKFRTMYHDASDHGAVRQTSRGDRRITRVGRLLRRFSIDELPQFLNVIRGEMSIVGPRPHALGMTAAGIPLRQAHEGYSARHRLKPGITGWAQVNACRGEIDTREKLRRRVALDCYYIDHWSLALDLKVILRTIFLIMIDDDAY